MLARRGDRLEHLARELDARDVRALALTADVTRDGDLERAAQAALDAFGSIDVVIANAGFGVSGRMDELTLDDVRRQFETNVFGVLRTLYATLGALKASRGAFAAVGSVASYLAMPTQGPYTMSKHAVRALCETLVVELAPHGVSTTHIAPGFIDTEIRRVDNRGTFRAERKEIIPRFAMMPSAVAARKIADAIAMRAPEVVLTGHGKLGVFFARHAPRTTSRIMRLAPHRPPKGDAPPPAPRNP